MKKIIITFSIIILLILTTDFIIYLKINNPKYDNIKFAKEYEITENNIFKYTSAKEGINILESGSGILFFASPDAFSREYAIMLNEVAINLNIDEIKYINVNKISNRNYEKLVNLLSINLLKDENGNYQIYTPNLTVVIDGIIVGNNNVSSLETGNVRDFWTKKRIKNFKNNIKNILEKTVSKTCYTCR